MARTDLSASLPYQSGATLIELALGLLITGLLTAGAIGILVQIQVIPANTGTNLVLDAQLRNGESWIRFDAARSQSFEPLPEPKYGAFRWEDLTTDPVGNGEVIYFFEDNSLLREVTGPPGFEEPPQVVVRGMATYNHATFTYDQTIHPRSSTSPVQRLTVEISLERDDGFTGDILKASTVVVEMRPGQILRLPTPTPSPTPAPMWQSLTAIDDPVDQGGSLTQDGTDLFGLRGDNTRNFYFYDVSENTWSSLADAPDNVSSGGALVYADGFVYALAGGTSSSFWRYDVIGGTWSVIASTPQNISWGGSLAWDGANTIYAQRGGNNRFFSYSISGNSWSTLTNEPNGSGAGGAIVFALGDVYATRGGGNTNFRRYNIGADTWTALADTPANVASGGALAFDGNRIWAFRGGNNPDFWRYDIGLDSWLLLPSAPADVQAGGSLAYLGAIYAFRGNTTTEFWRF